MNLGTLTTVCGQMINDSNLTRYSGLYTQALNLAQQQFALDTKCLWKDWTSTLIVAGTAGYSLPTDFMWEKQVLFDGKPLSPVSRLELARTHPSSRWDTITGTPTAYNIDPDVNKSQILVFPIPTSQDAGKSLLLTYYALPTDMVNSTDTPLNSTPLLSQFHIGIAAWAGWFLMQTEQSNQSIQDDRRELLNIYNDCVSRCVDTYKNTVSEPIRLRGVRNYSR